MRTQDLTLEQRRELLAAWDAAVYQFRLSGAAAVRVALTEPTPAYRFFRAWLECNLPCGAPGPAGTALGY